MLISQSKEDPEIQQNVKFCTLHLASGVLQGAVDCYVLFVCFTKMSQQHRTQVRERALKQCFILLSLIVNYCQPLNHVMTAEGLL